MIEINGKEYPAQIGTFLHEAHVEDLTGDTITALYDRMAKTPAKATTELIYSALLAGAEAEGVKLDLSLNELRKGLTHKEVARIVKEITPKEKKKADT